MMRSSSLLFYFILITLCFSNKVMAEDVNKAISLIRHVYVCGTASALDADEDVRKRLTPYRSLLPMNSSTKAEIRDVPVEKGSALLNYFLDQVGGHFSVGGVNTCGIAKATEQLVLVSCATTYVPGYEKVFLEFQYEHLAASHAKLILDAKQRSSTGGKYPASQVLSEGDQIWFGDLYKSLINELLVN